MFAPPCHSCGWPCLLRVTYLYSSFCLREHTRTLFELVGRAEVRGLHRCRCAHCTGFLTAAEQAELSSGASVRTAGLRTCLLTHHCLRLPSYPHSTSSSPTHTSPSVHCILSPSRGSQEPKAAASPVIAT